MWAMPLGEFLERVPSEELTLWMAFFAIEGWPEDRADMRSAITSATIASCHGSKASVAQFVPVFDAPPKQTWREVQAWCQARAEKNKE